jgi:hypothetical protein
MLIFKLRRITMKWLDYLPLALFNAAYIHIEPFEKLTEAQAFYIGAGTALCIALLKWFTGQTIDYIALGSYAFIAYGAVAFALFPQLLPPLDALQEASIFLFIVLVGIVTSLVRPEGFMQLTGVDASTIRQASWLLVALCVVAFISTYYLSVIAKLNPLVSVVLPFVLLLIIREQLRTHFNKAGAQEQ